VKTAGEVERVSGRPADGGTHAPGETARPAVAADNVWRGFGRDRVLRGVSLGVPAGTGVAVFGPNGSGKSTLLRVLAGLLRPQHGAVAVCGEDLYASPPARRHIGFVGHEPMLYAGLTVDENLRLYAALYGIEGARGRIDEVCALVELGRDRQTPAGRLSRGLAQRAALARALLHRPAVLLLDEPFTGLDPEAAARAASHLEQFRRAGGAVIAATHQAAEALRLAGEARLLAGGRLGAPLQLGGLDAAAVDAWYRAR
jgi:heme exporter protein A